MNPCLILLYAALLVISPLVASAQDSQPGPVIPRAMNAPPVQSPDLKHFDLNFPGGTPGALGEAISKATGKHLNLIIPTDYADTQIMPVKVSGVTVPDLFSAIRAASKREIPIISSVSSARGFQGGAQRNINFRSVGVEFQTTSSPITDESVWSFISNAPTKEYQAILASSDDSQPVCKYFQLAPYLLDHTVEDITTAIQTGWKLLKADPMPQLSFHEETKLLIAVGSEPYIEQIPRVLEQLMFDRESGTMQILKLQFELAEILSKKQVGWERNAQQLREEIEQLTIKQLLKTQAK